MAVSTAVKAQCVTDPTTPYTNTGSITCLTFDSTGTTVGAFSGNITNATSGSITGSTSSADSLSVGIGTNITGSIINNGSIAIGSGASNAISVVEGSVSGDIDNTSTGTISGAGNGIFLSGAEGGAGISIVPATIGGAINNSGAISVTGDGIYINNDQATVASIDNSGTIVPASTPTGAAGIYVENGGAVTNAITNSGTIGSASYDNMTGIEVEGSVGSINNTATGAINESLTTGTGILIGGSIINEPSFQGGITNAGSISGYFGIDIQNATLGGPIINTGTITGGANGAAIYLSPVGTGFTDTQGALSAVTIDQEGGTINGNVYLSTFGDTVNITGGAINGFIEGNYPNANGANAGTINFNLPSGSTFALGAGIAGVAADVAQININSGVVNFEGGEVEVYSALTNNATLEVLDYAVHDVGGNFVQAASGNLIIGVEPTALSQVVVTGTANLDGTVTFAYAPGTYSATKEIFLQAQGGLTGAFSTVAATGTSGLNQSVTYDAENAYLNLSATPTPTPTPTPAPTPTPTPTPVPTPTPTPTPFPTPTPTPTPAPTPTPTPTPAPTPTPTPTPTPAPTPTPTPTPAPTPTPTPTPAPTPTPTPTPAPTPTPTPTPTPAPTPTPTPTTITATTASDVVTAVDDANAGDVVHLNIAPGTTVSLSGVSVPTYAPTTGSLTLGNGTPDGFAGTLSAGTFTFNSPLAIEESHDGGAITTISAVLAGSGQLQIFATDAANSQGLILSGENTYSGGTVFESDATVGGNQLTLGDGVNIGSLGTGAVTTAAGVSGSLIFDEPSTVTVANAITGDILIDQTGPGPVILTGANNTTGGVAIAQGSTLQLGDGVATSVVGAVTGIRDSGTLVFDEGGAVKITGVISDDHGDGPSGSVIQEGSGTVTLDGVNTYAGLTEIKGGELIVGDEATPTAQIGGNVQVDVGGTLGGTGTILGNVVNDGTLNNNDPFLPAGLTISGNYTQGANANLIIGVTPTTTTLLTIGGTAALAGTVTFQYAPGSYRPTSLVFLRATGGLGGTTFTTVAASQSNPVPTGMTQSVAYAPTTASLVLSAQVIVTPRDPNIYTVGAFAFTEANRSAVEDLLGRTRSDGGGNTFYNLGPAGGDQTRGWMDAIGSIFNASATSSTPSLHENSGGLDGGLDVAVGEGGRIGGSIGYAYGSLSDGDGSSVIQNVIRAGLYGSQTLGAVGLSAALSYAHGSDEVGRASGFGNAVTSRDSNEVTGAVELSAPFEASGATITPAAGVSAAYLSSGAFDERNPNAAAFAVSGSSLNATDVSPFVKVGVSKTFSTAAGWVVTPDAEVGYRYVATTSGDHQRLTALDGTNFDDNRADFSRNNALLGVSLTAHKGQWTGFVKYRATLSSGWTDQSAKAGFRLAF